MTKAVEIKIGRHDRELATALASYMQKRRLNTSFTGTVTYASMAASCTSFVTMNVANAIDGKPANLIFVPAQLAFGAWAGYKLYQQSRARFLEAQRGLKIDLEHYRLSMNQVFFPTTESGQVMITTRRVLQLQKANDAAPGLKY